MVVVGSDPDELERLAAVVEAESRRLATSTKELTALLGAAPWFGRGATSFRSEWTSLHARALLEASQHLRSGAVALGRNAREQRSASDGSTGVISTGEPPRRGDRQIDEPMPVERPHRFGPFTWGEGEMPRRDYRDVPLFDGPPGQEITPSDVRQGSIGNCYFVASLAAMAATPEGRARLEQMIRDNGDGTFTVTFADGQQVTVDDDFYVDASGNPLYAKSNGDIWAMILEEAYAHRRGDYGDLNRGGQSVDALNALGMPSDRIALSSISSRDLTAHLAEGRTMVFQGSLDQPGGITSSYQGNHAFSVVGSTILPDGELQVTVRNPWGSNEGLRFPAGVTVGPDGTFTCSIDDLRAIFYDVAIAR